ncbi:MAG: 16S rRNA (adenine(1518)-N(6)/adenine(1519)-N(6))-dimethyltransferase RsmA [Synergistales bacterium]|nr:16S rRNA (adenine(1518)-N(6)/adenine(1519)-N(6))-dimethyltransferase RsmA [Synergistales bacterium]
MTTHRRSTGFVPAKRYGQHFLTDRNLLHLLIREADIGTADSILEIGPGKGTLTSALLQSPCMRVEAVEIDERFREFLEPLREEDSRLHLHWGDAVRFHYDTLSPPPTRVVANLPYNVTTPLLWAMLEQLDTALLRHIVVTVQKEVGDRLLGAPGTKQRSPLGITLEAMGRVRLVRTLPPEAFTPPPKVASCILAISLTGRHGLPRNRLWRSLLRCGFAQRRKTLGKNLRLLSGELPLPPRGAIDRAGLGERLRAEELTTDQWLRLAAELGMKDSEGERGL